MNFFLFISLQPIFCFIFLLLSLQLSYPPSICQLSHHASIFTISFPFLLIWNQRLNEKNIRIVISHWLTFLHELFFLLTVESSAWCLELSCLRHCELINEWHSLSPAPRISLSSRRMVLIGLVKNKPRLPVRWRETTDLWPQPPPRILQHGNQFYFWNCPLAAKWNDSMSSTRVPQSHNGKHFISRWFFSCKEKECAVEVICAYLNMFLLLLFISLDQLDLLVGLRREGILNIGMPTSGL